MLSQQQRKECIMDKTLFAEVEIKETILSTGVRIGLPVRYYDWSWMNAIFPAPAAKVQLLLPSKKLKPLLLMPGTAMVALTAMEYRQLADVGPYNEFSIGVLVQCEPTINVPGLPLLFNPLLSPRWYENFGVYIHHLPVTTKEAYDFGVEIWGYPKFVAEISFEDIDQIHRCRLRAEGKDIVTLEVKKLATKARRISLYSYTVKNGQLLKTPIQTQGEYGIAKFPGGASYILGDHPIAEELKTLGMGKNAVGRFYAPQVQSLLHAASTRLAL